MLRAAAPVDVLPVMEQERAELVRFLESLTAEDAGTPTICDGWTVGDIAVHLLGGDLSFLSRNRDRKESTLGDRAGGWDDLVGGLDALNEGWVSGGHFLSTRLVAELLEVTGRLMSEFLEGVDSKAAGETVSWAGPDPAPWWLVAAREFTERWVHHQQIRDALERPGLNGPSFVAPILATAMRGLPPAYLEVDAPEQTTVAFDVTGRAGFSWAVRRDAEGWKLYEGLSREATTRLTLDQDTAWRFLMRMATSAEVKPKVAIDGDPAYAKPFFDAVSAIVRRG
ncbi:MAG: maleylpyruvate isomerase N-terminal domain-containing protein [Actinomycetota bacterium]